MAVKILPPIVLSSKQYALLARQARANERDPLQQARYLIKLAIMAGMPGGEEGATRPADVTTADNQATAVGA